MNGRRAGAARVVVRLINWYRCYFSPLRPPTCRYSPTCSEYAAVAIERFGAGPGSWLALRRLLRCGPWHQGGYDPVPAPVRRIAVVTPAPSQSRPLVGSVADLTKSDPRQSERTTTRELEPQL